MVPGWWGHKELGIWPLILKELEINFKKLEQHTGNRKSLWTGCEWWMRSTPGYSAWQGEVASGQGGLAIGWARVREWTLCPDRPQERDS